MPYFLPLGFPAVEDCGRLDPDRRRFFSALSVFLPVWDVGLFPGFLPEADVFRVRAFDCFFEAVLLATISFISLSAFLSLDALSGRKRT